jgi:peroxiredoxin
LQKTSEQQKFGEPLVDFSLRTLNGGAATVESFVSNKKGIVVVIWSSTCSHCFRYDKYFNTFADRHPELGLLVVSSRQGEALDAVKKAATERSLRFPIAHDASSEVAGKWFTRQTPRAFLLDSNRVLRYRGAIDNYKYTDDPEYIPYLEPAIEQFLKGKPIERPETASYGCAIQSVYYILPRAL